MYTLPNIIYFIYVKLHTIYLYNNKICVPILRIN